jgi:proteic killer suppression protein
VIQSFGDETTRRVWDLERAPRLGADVQRTAHKRLQMLDVARTINDLRVPPGNRLEKLAGDRSGQCSIRVNDQYRICFTWTDAGPVDVQIVDYH